MNRIMLAAALVAAASPAAAAEHRYSVTDFDRIVVEGPFDVTLATGRASAALVSGSGNVSEFVSLEVQGRTLRIRPNRTDAGAPRRSTGPLKVDLATHNLRGATLTGSGSIAIDKVRALRFDLAVSGSGEASIKQVEADAFYLGLLGSGRVALAGRAKTFRATIEGHGDLDAAALSVDDAELQSETAGAITLTVNRAAKITAAGAGDIAISGSPSCTVRATGSGAVRCGRN